jgi:hypothetical protein
MRKRPKLEIERIDKRERERTDNMNAHARVQTAISAQLESLNVLVDTHLEAYAAPRCQALCEMVQQKLPRELRDLVYQYILEDDFHLSGRLHAGHVPETLGFGQVTNIGH